MQGGGNSKKESKEMLYIKNHGAQKKNAFNRLIRDYMWPFMQKRNQTEIYFPSSGH